MFASTPRSAPSLSCCWPTGMFDDGWDLAHALSSLHLAQHLLEWVTAADAKKSAAHPALFYALMWPWSAFTAGSFSDLLVHPTARSTRLRSCLRGSLRR